MARQSPRGFAPIFALICAASLGYCGVDERFRLKDGPRDAGTGSDVSVQDASGGEHSGTGGQGAGGVGGAAATGGDAATSGDTGRGGTGQAGTGQAGTQGGTGAGGQADCTDPREPGSCVPEVGLKIALFGDQGASPQATAVLQLVKDEGADFVIHLGDFDYLDNPELWEQQIDATLGADFPYFAAVGNHDVVAWPEYQRRLQARAERTEGALCSGDYGVNSMCRYKGLFFVLSGVGTLGQGHAEFLDKALAAPDLWKICAWHKNQADMQTGEKTDEVGWAAYQICQAHGAIIATGHEHAYARSFTLNQLGNAASQHGKLGQPQFIELAPGRALVVVAGLGGNSIRPFSKKHQAAQWWATAYTSDTYWRNGQIIGKFTPAAGALFVKFGTATHAHAYFKNIRREIVDAFDIDVSLAR